MKNEILELSKIRKIALFDMDNTILRSSFINTAAEKFGFKKRLIDIVAHTNNPFIRTKLIAWLLKGRSVSDLLELTDHIEVTPNLQELIAELKRRDYITGIISESYDCVTNHFKNQFCFDFTISNKLEFSNSIATGEVKIPSLFFSGLESQCDHDHCKLNALIKISRQFKVDLKNTLMIGDGENDICCIRKAGIGISFCSTSTLVDSVADYAIKMPDFGLLIPILA